MSQSAAPPPLTRPQAIDRYFLEHRAKVLDIAAYLDRLDQSGPSEDTTSGGDFRERALRDAIAILIDGKPDRAKRVLELLSDPTTEPIDKAPGQGAAGAYAKT